MYAIKITYFTYSGKYFAEGTCASKKQQLYSIWQEVETNLRQNLTRPGFSGCTDLFFHALIDIPTHKYNKPCLVANIKRVYKAPLPERKKKWIPPKI